MKLRKKNKGFTLVEVCIASAILAIAISPFVANFVQASKMNLESRKDLNAMNLAQDVLEGTAVYTASDLNELLACSVSDDVTKKNSILQILPTGTSFDAASTYGGPKDDGAGGIIKNLYEYNIYGVQTVAGSNYNTYDMRITVDGREKDDSNQVVSGKYAERDYANISTVDAYFDATFKMPGTEISTAIAKIKQPGVDEAAYKGKIKRTITLNMVNKGDDANPDYEIRVDRTYQVADSADYAALGSDEQTIAGENISKADSYIFPRSIYLYYEGLENAKYNNDLETIKINNTTGKNVTVYLIRTITSELSYSDDTKNYNRDYGCDVYVNTKVIDETDDAGNLTGNKAGMTYLVSNLRYNLCEEPENNFRIYKEGSTELAKNVVETAEEVTANPGKDYKYKGDSKYSAARAKYYYDSTGLGTSFVEMDEDTYSKFVSDGYKKKEDASLVYKVTVELFEAGTSNRTAIYTGGLID